MSGETKQMQIRWLCYAVGGFSLTWFGSTCTLEGRVTANQYKVVLSDHLYPMMKHFYHMLWPSQSPDLNPIEHLWEVLDRHVRQRSPPGRMVFSPPVEFRDLKSMSGCTEADLVARGDPTPYLDTLCWFFL